MDGNLEEYQMVVHPFGAVSSPSCANFALKQASNESEKEQGSLVADMMRRNVYVDDCLKSVALEDVAIPLIAGLCQACFNGCFRLTKFICNSCTVLESLPEEERSNEVQSLDLDYDTLPIE